MFSLYHHCLITSRLHFDLIHRRKNLSTSRSRLLLSDAEAGSSPYADTVFDTTEYLMKLQIGTPPFEIEVLLDTGSELLWTQCLPCINCYNQVAPIFDPSKSSTFKEKRCHGHSCPYEVVYEDNSYSRGIYATETVTIQSTSGEPFVMTETTIGCGHDNTPSRSSTSGVVGLSWASMSLSSQFGEDYLGLISYCFSGKGTSKINFGSNAIVAGDGTVATDMFMKKENPGFYYLNLDAISVGENRVETLGTPFHALDGNIMIDSGTTYTYLPEGYCNQVKEAVINVVTADQVHVELAQNMICYNSDTLDNFPVITMHFAGGADLVLDKYNMFMEYIPGTYCLTILCNDPTQEAIFGNRAQNNLLIGYDPSSLVVSFQPTDCAALWN